MAKHLLLPKEASNNRRGVGLYLIKLLSKGILWEKPKQPKLLPKLQVALHKLTAKCSTDEDNTHTTREYGEVEPVPMQSFHLLASLVQEDALHILRSEENVNSNPAMNALIYSYVLPAR